jgi:hypothetical protein
MAYELKDNSGSIFRNEKREKDTHPHGTGKCLIGGVLYYVSAWTKEGTNGRFQSLSFKPVETKQETEPSQNNRTRPAGNKYPDDQEIPF